MRAIFISYRRDDSEGEAGRLFDDLVGQFGEDSVFMDVTAIAPGRDFRKAIDESVATCGVLLAIIGQNWVDAKNEAGRRRLDDPTDFVRLETASALKRDIPVVPVLIRGAKMPRPEQLPDDVKDLAYRNGVELTHARWASDVQLLIRALRPLVPDLSANAGPAAGTAQKSPGPARESPSAVDVSRSRGNPPDGARPVDRQPEHGGAGPDPGPSPTHPRRTKWLVAAGGIMVMLALAGYGVYSSFTGDQAKRTAEQQRRAAEEEAAKRRTEAERAEFAQKKADLERDAAKFASEKTAAEKAAAEKAVADKAAAERAEADRRREAAETARRVAAEKAATEKAAADRAEADRRREAAETERRLAAERAQAEKAAADRAEAERRREAAAAERRAAAAEKTPQPPSSARAPAVMERQKLMKANGEAWKGAQAKAKAGNLAGVATDADTMAQNAKKIPALFPPGSLEGKTAAKPVIWQKWAEFEAAAKNYEVEAGKLRDTAKTGNAEATQALVKDFGRKACGTCHTPFRVPPPPASP